MHRILVLFIGLLLSVTIAVGQEVCSALINTALENIDSLCSETGRNQLCYGNQLISITTSEVEPLNFSMPGDIVSVGHIQSMNFGALSEPDQWGLALMNIQANLPNTLPGQNVTVLLFGDIQIENAVAPTESLSATTTSNANVRKGPSTNTSVKFALSSGTALDLIGRNAAGDWVYFTAEEGQEGWLFASLLNIEGDVSTLRVVPDAYATELEFTPMQAIYVETGIGDSRCSEVPDSGILIRTPDSVEGVELFVNDVQLKLGSTAYLQAERGNQLWVYLVEGQATVTAQGESYAVPAGAFTTVPVDDDLRASGVPNEPQPYDLDELGVLPLFDAPVSTEATEIVVADPATAVEIETAQESIVSGFTGTWVGTDRGDNSTQTMTLTPIGNRQYQYIYFDDGACQGNTMQGEGIALQIDNQITVTADFVCTDPAATTFTAAEFGTFTITYIAGNDSLNDSAGNSWSRQ